MQVELITLGTVKNKDLKKVIDDYEKRVNKFCKLKVIELKDVRTDIAKEMVLEKERQEIEKHLDTNSYIIVLDIEGKQFTSEQFSQKVKDITTYEKGKITFIIGGSYGISDEIKRKANLKMSFSKMTFPHQLFRLIFLEQLYRQFKILANEPYHK